MTTERKLADTINQMAKQIKVGTREYERKPANLATIYELSALISEGAEIDKEGNIVYEVFKKAKENRNMPQILATMILTVPRPEYRTKEYKNELKDLTEYILYDVTPSEWANIFSDAMSGLEVGPFGEIMRFLSEFRITKPTKTTNRTAPSPM